MLHVVRTTAAQPTKNDGVDTIVSEKLRKKLNAKDPSKLTLVELEVSLIIVLNEYLAIFLNVLC